MLTDDKEFQKQFNNNNQESSLRNSGQSDQSFPPASEAHELSEPSNESN